MKRMRGIFSSIGSLGTFGLIILLITLAVLITWLTIGAINEPAISINRELVKLSTLEDRVNYLLLELDIHADYYEFSKGNRGYLLQYDQADAGLRETLADLDMDVRGFTPEDTAYYQDLLKALDAHNQAFLSLQAGVDQNNAEAITAAQDELATQTEFAQETVTDWIHQIEANYAKSLADKDTILIVSMYISVFGLVCIPMLAFWAFSKVGDITRPILVLTDTVTAIQGGHLRSENLAEIAERRDNLGQFARDIEVMYQRVMDRQKSLEIELDDLRQQLKNERRRKRT